MIRFRLYYDKDAEVEWLNRLVGEGYAMDRFFAGFYHFVPCEKGEWQYQVDIGHGFGGVSREFKEFMNEMDVEVVQSWGPWVYLRRKAQEGEFQLYTDVDSAIGQYKKIALLFKLAILLEMACMILEVYYATVGGQTIAWAIVCLIVAIVLGMFNALIRTRKIIYELQERKGEAPAAPNGRRVSALIPVGFLLNAVHLLAADHIPTAIRFVFLGISMAMILIGAVQTAASRNG
ncbi:MAG: DUF2812 domain-containing protein [Lachnospiraceae bacterium]|nr:DUF2812 domain-containing protein [Lachnospiraceae bacterium]